MFFISHHTTNEAKIEHQTVSIVLCASPNINILVIPMNDIKMAKLVEIYKGECPIQNIDFCYE